MFGKIKRANISIVVDSKIVKHITQRTKIGGELIGFHKIRSLITDE